MPLESVLVCFPFGQLYESAYAVCIERVPSFLNIHINEQLKKRKEMKRKRPVMLAVVAQEWQPIVLLPLCLPTH